MKLFDVVINTTLLTGKVAVTLTTGQGKQVKTILKYFKDFDDALDFIRVEYMSLELS